jgi:hypothetical protein
MPAGKIPLLYTDGTGTFTIDGVVVKGHTQFTLTLNEDLAPRTATTTSPTTSRSATRRSRSASRPQFDADGLAQFNKLAYGTATPAADTAPLTRLPGDRLLQFYLKARDSAGALNGDEFKLTIPASSGRCPDAPTRLPRRRRRARARRGAPRKVRRQPAVDDRRLNDAAAFTVGT